MQRFDIGNHHFPALARTALAEALVKTAPPNMRRGDLRRGRRRGHRHRDQDRAARHASGARSSRSSRPTTATPGSPSPPATTASRSCSWPTGRTSSSRCRSTTWTRWRRRCARGDVAAVIMETIPATYGFPLPEPGYLQGVKRLCERYGALYIADEVQTGLMRTGEMWGITKARRRARTSWSPARASPAACTRSRAVLVTEECCGLAEARTASATSPPCGGAELGCVVGAEGAGDLRPAGGALDGALHRRPLRPRPARDPGSCTPTGSSASARTAWSWASSSTTRRAPSS